VLANQGVTVPMSDLFGIGDNQLLDRAAMSTAARARVGSARRLRDAFDFEIELFTKLTSGRLAKHPGSPRCKRCPGSGRYWARCWSPRSARSPGSAGRRMTRSSSREVTTNIRRLGL
jgi:hypothetical protein